MSDDISLGQADSSPKSGKRQRSPNASKPRSAAKEWRYRPVTGLDAPLKSRLGSFRRRPEMWTYLLRSLSQWVTRLVLKHYHRLEIHGTEHLPKDASFVLVANHVSHLDALCLGAATPWSMRHRVFAAAASDYFFSRTVTAAGAVVGVNALPFDRQGGGEESLNSCRDLLTERNPSALIIFPEGTRAADGQLGRFRSGIGRLVAGTDIPVVPCHLSGAHGAWPKGSRWPRPGKLLLRIGRPETCSVDGNDFEAVQAFVGRLRSRVVELAEQSSQVTISGQ